MRADRLLALMILLQRRGKMTTQALAQELEVSRRTVLRDVEALEGAQCRDGDETRKQAVWPHLYRE